MICPDCGAENRAGASFCTGCGTPLGTEETTFKLMAQDGTEYPIIRPVTTIGREECDILLLNDDQVSRRHAQVERQGETLALTDLDSTNGTFVGGVRLQGPHTLQPGDVIQVGHAVLTVCAAGKAGATHLMSEPPQWQAPSAPGPGVGPQVTPAPVYQAPAAYGQPTKDKAIAYVLEILLLGLGWIYAGETGTGIAILVSWIIVGLVIGITIDLATGGFGCLCTVPLAILAYVLSLTQLSKYIKARPHIFR